MEQNVIIFIIDLGLESRSLSVNKKKQTLTHTVTHHRLNTVDFVPEKLASIIKSLNPNKAHGWDEISVRMIQICGDALIPPLIIIFNNIITTGIYPSSCKKANIVPIHKKRGQNSC